MDGDNYVVLARFKFLNFIFLFLFLFSCRFGGYDPLVLASHVAFFVSFDPGNNLFMFLTFYEGPGKVVSFPDGLNPRKFCWEDRGTM